MRMAAQAGENVHCPLIEERNSARSFAVANSSSSDMGGSAKVLGLF